MYREVTDVHLYISYIEIHTPRIIDLNKKVNVEVRKHQFPLQDGESCKSLTGSGRCSGLYCCLLTRLAAFSFSVLTKNVCLYFSSSSTEHREGLPVVHRPRIQTESHPGAEEDALSSLFPGVHHASHLSSGISKVGNRPTRHIDL